jgi:putative flippase GtrA
MSQPPPGTGRGLRSTLVRFATVGVANTAIDLTVFWVLHAPLGIVLANFVSTSAGMTFSFLANGRHTFRVRRLTLRQAALFLGTNGFTMWLLQPLLIYAAREVGSLPLMPAKLIALGVSVVVNFLFYRYLVWPIDRAPYETSDPRDAPAFEMADQTGLR